MVCLIIHGNDSKYFNEFNKFDTVGAYQGKKSKYYNWYKKNSKGNFEYWWGFKNLPVCDGNNKEWQKYIYGKNGIIDQWFRLGIDGLRLDVADELTDDFIENIRIAVKRNNKDGFILGEVWENAITKEKDGVQRKYLLGKGLDSVMNYPFTNAILKYIRFGDFQNFKNTIEEIKKQYPKEALQSVMNSLSTHDITRALTTLTSNKIKENNQLIWDVNKSRKWQFENNNLKPDMYDEGKKKLKLATIIQYLLPGNSCIYYGDEIGMFGYKDPFNRQCFEWDNIDTELYNFFVELGKIKTENSFLASADIRIIEANENVLIFERNSKNEAILVVINRTNKKQSVTIPTNYLEKSKELLNQNYKKNILGKYGYVILKNQCIKK